VKESPDDSIQFAWKFYGSDQANSLSPNSLNPNSLNPNEPDLSRVSLNAPHITAFRVLLPEKRK
jgi:hypothetical protein